MMGLGTTRWTTFIIALLAGMLLAGAVQADEAALVYTTGDADPGISGGVFGWQPFNITRRFTSSSKLWIGFQLPDVGADGVISFKANKSGQPVFDYYGYYGTTAAKYDSAGVRTPLSFPPATENVLEELSSDGIHSLRLRFSVTPDTSFVYFSTQVTASRFSNTYIYGAESSCVYTPVYGPPAVASITPSSAPNSASTSVTISGSGFVDGATVELQKLGETAIAATSVSVVSRTEISCDLDITGAAIGLWDVAVTNPDTQSALLPDGFEVLNGDISPPSVARWSVAAVHGAGVGELRTDIGGGYVEPRTSAADCIVVHFSEPLDAGTIGPSSLTIVGAASGDQSGLIDSVTLEGDGSVACIYLAATLPEPDRYAVTVGDTVCDLAGNALAGVRTVQLDVLHGDANGNATVDVGDMLAVRGHFGAVVDQATCCYDINGDGIVDIADLLAIRGRYGRSIPAP